MKKILLTLLVSLFVFSCGNDEKKSKNNTNNVQPLPKVKGSTFLVNAMSFDKLPESSLNGLIVSNLDQENLEYPIVILLDFMDIDLNKGTLIIRGGAGLKTEKKDEYIWDPQADTTTDRGAGTIDKDGNFEATIELFEFVATVKDGDSVIKNKIPIHNLKITGKLELKKDGTLGQTFTDATIEGYISEEDGDNTNLALNADAAVSLTFFFKKKNLNYSIESKMIVPKKDPSADAWFLVGKLSAAKTTVK